MSNEDRTAIGPLTASIIAGTHIFDGNRTTAHRIANSYALDKNATGQLEEQVFTELQIAQKRGEIIEKRRTTNPKE